MVRIRLSRAGTKKAPFYRIVVTDHRSPRGGRFLETIGTFDPRSGKGDGKLNVKTERLTHWTNLGAQVSDTVAAVIKKQAKTAAATAA
jgi:small subunit ribosomal protein S16